MLHKPDAPARDEPNPSLALRACVAGHGLRKPRAIPLGARVPSSRKLSLAAPGEVVIGSAMPFSCIRLACLSLLLAVSAGCSTAPIADLLDWCEPGRLEPAKTAPYGGVCTPRPVAPPAPLAGVLPLPAVPTVPGALPGPAPGSLESPPGAQPCARLARAGRCADLRKFRRFPRRVARRPRRRPAVILDLTLHSSLAGGISRHPRDQGLLRAWLWCPRGRGKRFDNCEPGPDLVASNSMLR